ncbi:MAG: hypothetical protein IJA86_08155, partial [Clostridia bacterium]|nr:hypothetical protein [Clostridia bacterium]
LYFIRYFLFAAFALKKLGIRNRLWLLSLFCSLLFIRCFRSEKAWHKKPSVAPIFILFVTFYSLLSL